MSSDKKIPGDDAPNRDAADLSDAVESATAQALAAGGATLLTAPAWAAGVAAGATFLASMWPSVRQRFHRRTGRLAQSYAPGETENEAARRLDEAATHGDNASVIVEMYRRVQEAVDDAVIPALGRLLREYTDAVQPVDRYLRGTSRLLAELDGPEFGELRRLLGYLTSVVEALDTPVDVLTVLESERGAGNVVVKGHDEVSGELKNLTTADRLLTSLARYGLGREAILWGDGAGLDIAPVMVLRLDRLVNPSDECK